MSPRILLIGIIAMLIGCAMSKEMYLPDGSKGYNISCDGSANSMGNCFQKAGELCGSKGYYLLNREGQAIPFGTNVGSASVVLGGGSAGYVAQTGMMVTRSLFIKCKE
ncbi:hypothetical protein [Nitrosomonas sp.]|uniref:hypothetical protein n=1 Tax=Nitrosomonas sp. TaxID=42353 RepID=UPI0025E092BB|nr:hypothetical protein [Nitrosomonas sp.]MBY0484226.1 hypothetical protein [Nitrosomonas sp.]